MDNHRLTAAADRRRNGEPAQSNRQELPEVEFELFSSSFCGACDVTRAVLDQALRVLPTAHVREHNIADALDLANKYDIGVTPTVIVRNAAGDEVMRAAGIPTIHHLMRAAEHAMGLANAATQHPEENHDRAG